eukprot:m.22520 g.22520  ORF g.22520 m.22520 type:complete len:435 (-) comp7408_c0_seq1:90-1394(-)
METSRRGSHLTVQPGRHLSVERDIDDNKVIYGINLTIETVFEIESLFTAIDVDKNGALEQADFASLGFTSQEHWTKLKMYLLHDDNEPLTLNRLILGLKEKAISQRDSFLSAWMHTIPTNQLPGVPLVTILDETANKVNQSIRGEVAEMFSWVAHLNLKPTGQLSLSSYTVAQEDIQAVIGIQFNDQTLKMMNELWTRLDADKSDDLTLNDLNLLCGSRESAPVWIKLLNYFDEDNSGTIDKKEFMTRFSRHALKAPALNFSADATSNVVSWIAEIQRCANNAVQELALSIAAEIPAIGNIKIPPMIRGDNSVLGPFSLSPQARRLCLEVFNTLGPTGAITRTDLERRFNPLVALTKWAHLVQIMDVNGDGVITFEEFESQIVRAVLQSPANIQSIPPAATTFAAWLIELNNKLDNSVLETCRVLLEEFAKIES